MVGADRIGILAHELDEFWMDEEFLFSGGCLFQDPDPAELFKVNGSGLAFGDARFHKVVDAAIGLPKKGVHQLM